jgi:hypothetical protein
MINLTVVGDAYLAAAFRQAIRYADTEMKAAMREAGKLLRREAISILSSGSPLASRGGTVTKKGTKIGPLKSSVALSVFPRRDAAGMVRTFAARVKYKPTAFYGKFHETGIPMKTLQKKGGKGKRYTWTLPMRSVFDPTVERKGDAAASVVGDGYIIGIERAGL